MIRPPAFTRQVANWTPWVETVHQTDATPAQLAVVDRIVGWRRSGRAFWAALAHDADVLERRHDLFEEMLGDKSDEGGAACPDLELAATAASRQTGCVYNASVRARAYAQATEDVATIDAVLAGDSEADLPARERAIARFATRLADAPGEISGRDIEPLREAGLSDPEIYDVAHAAAMSAWANRVTLTLGRQTIPPWTRR